MKDGDQDIPLELIETIEGLRVWSIRACFGAAIMVLLAILIKYTLIAPYSTSVIEFEIKVNTILKKDIEI